jgi:hypothetical protein
MDKAGEALLGALWVRSSAPRIVYRMASKSAVSNTTACVGRPETVPAALLLAVAGLRFNFEGRRSIPARFFHEQHREAGGGQTPADRESQAAHAQPGS